MKTACSFGVTILVLSQALQAADSVRLELAIHEVARSAKRAQHESILILAREDSRSTRRTDTVETLDALAKQAHRMLAREPGVSGVLDEKATETATKTKSRRNLRPPEAGAFLGGDDRDVVLTLDFREYRGRFSVRVTLVDSAKTLLTETVTLEARPIALPEEPEKPKDKPKSKPDPKNEIDGETGIPKPSDGPTGYIVRRKGPRTGIARTRGGPGSVGIPVTGIGQRERKDGDFKKGDREKPTGDRERGETRPTDQEGEAKKEKTDNAAPRGKGPTTRTARDIVRFASAQLGKQVGNGECWTLAAEALKAAGAEPPKGYTFGDEIPLKDIEPGDILQFTTARFEEPGYWAVMGTPNHTAVVYSLGDRTFILHQNVGGKKYVQTFDLDFDTMTSGKVQAYRPRPAAR